MAEVTDCPFCLRKLEDSIIFEDDLSIDKDVGVWQKSRPYEPRGFNVTKVDHIHFHVLPSDPGNEPYDRGIVWTRDMLTATSAEDILETVDPLHQH